MTLQEKTVVSKLKSLSQSHPQMEAIVFYDEFLVRTSLSMEELYTLSARFAHVLKKEGVMPGDYVTCNLPLSPEAVIVNYGVCFAGAVPLHLEMSFKNGDAVTHSIAKVKSRLLILKDHSDNHLLNLLRPYMNTSRDTSSFMATLCWVTLPYLKSVMLVRRSEDRDQSFMERLKRSDEEYVWEGIRPDTIAFTHITTGSPTEYLKMTDRTHASVLDTIKQFHDALRPSYPKHLYTNPLFWMSSLPRDYFNGITRVSPDKWYPIKDYCELLYKVIVTEDVQYADLQPVHAAGIIEKMGKQGPLLDHLFIVGMPVSKAMLQTVKPLANWFTLGYGSHETGGTSFNILHTDDIEQFQDFDNGLPAPGVQIRIVDENWTDVCAGSKGRVLIKTPAMFSGYSMEPEKTAQRFDSDHWFITNDIGRLDERTGHLFVGGRMDSIILHGEYMIYPFWLEEMLSTHPDIKEVVIVPVSDPVLFHAIGAIVIKKPNSTLTVNDIQSKISEFIVPEVMDIVRVKHLMFVDTFPRKQDGSLDRSQLYDLMQEHVVKYFKTK